MVEASFTRKKIESLTLGEKLRKLRNETHIPLAEVSRATRIRVKYLELLESGETNEVYRMSIALFPLSEIPSRKRELMK
jgi:transcriptional regulator with XRE-family HTH domain